jgi:hypothetical protein
VCGFFSLFLFFTNIFIFSIVVTVVTRRFNTGSTQHNEGFSSRLRNWLAPAHTQRCAHHRAQHVQAPQRKNVHQHGDWCVVYHSSLSLRTLMCPLPPPSPSLSLQRADHARGGTYGASMFPTLHTPPRQGGNIWCVHVPCYTHTASRRLTTHPPPPPPLNHNARSKMHT